MATLRLISDGKPGGTKIVDIETGEHLRHVRSFKFEWEFGRPAILTVETTVTDIPFYSPRRARIETVVSESE